MSIGKQVIGSIALIGFVAASAAAQVSPTPVQDRQFMFSVSTPPTDVRHATVHLESGFGARAFDVTNSDRPEQRFGVQAAVGHRFTFLGRVGLSSDERDVRSSQQAELLFGVLEAPESQSSLAVGLGMRHESAGVNVLLGRVAAGRSFAAWRLDGNALIEKPYSIGRDPVDLITTFGVSRRILPSFHAGIELIGEDLEGFWVVEEAEGGARLLIGPSIRIAPPAKRWQIGVAGGPMLHATRSARSSDAFRGLPPSNSDSSYALRASLSYGF
jgi:hypothetical protein